MAAFGGLCSFLRRLAVQVALLFLIFLIALLWAAGDKAAATSALAAGGVALCYVLLPWDVVPDWIPIIGKLDDYAAMAAVLAAAAVCGLYYPTETKNFILRSLFGWEHGKRGTQ